VNRITTRVSWRTCASSLAVLWLLVVAQACGTASQSSDAGRADASQAASRTSPAPPATTSGDLRAYRVIARVERRQLVHFALLRSRPEELPARVRRALRTPIVGMNWNLAQRILVTLPGTFWLVPGNHHLCIVQQGSLGSPGVGTTCAQTSQAIEHGIANITIKRAPFGSSVGQSRLIVGMAPGGTRKVLVHTRGSVATVPVAGEVFVLRDSIAAPPDILTLR
jgi:hypothetical protein